MFGFTPDAHSRNSFAYKL